MAPASPAPFTPMGLSGDSVIAVAGFDARHIQAGWQVIIHEGAVEQLPVLVVDQTLVEGVADALGHAAVDLSIQDQRD